MVVGSSIKNLRQNKNLTQKDLAKRLGVSRQALCMWESDKRQLKAPILRKIAKVFEVPVDYLLNPKYEKENTSISKRKKRNANFSLFAPKAKKVILTGDFNGWDENQFLMKKSKGIWSIKLKILPGRYEYKFIVDNEWWTDPSNKNTAVSAFGSLNSVKELTL